MKKITNSCGGSGCSVPAHEQILPKGVIVVKPLK